MDDPYPEAYGEGEEPEDGLDSSAEAVARAVDMEDEEVLDLNRRTALAILGECLIPAASKIRAMVAGQEDISRAKFEICRWAVEFFFGKNKGEATNEADWDKALKKLASHSED